MSLKNLNDLMWGWAAGLPGAKEAAAAFEAATGIVSAEPAKAKEKAPFAKPLAVLSAWDRLSEELDGEPLKSAFKSALVELGATEAEAAEAADFPHGEGPEASSWGAKPEVSAEAAAGSTVELSGFCLATGIASGFVGDREFVRWEDGGQWQDLAAPALGAAFAAQGLEAEFGLCEQGFEIRGTPGDEALPRKAVEALRSVGAELDPEHSDEAFLAAAKRPPAGLWPFWPSA